MAKRGPEAFHEYYQGIYGSRWQDLKESLLSPVRQVARINKFADQNQVETRAQGFPRTEFAGCEVLLLAEKFKDESRFQPATDYHNLFDFYFMDPASIFAAAALEPRDGDEILDMCAAPGGKSLILAERMGANGRLISNEISDKRRGRLRAVIEDYLPEEIRSRVKITGHDAGRWCLHETEAFDRILVDAPCSGERHLLNDVAEMKQWSPARSKNLAIRQYSLLASALAVVRPGGRIVYSTCSISPLENDAIISRLLKKRAGEARVLSPRLEIGEPTEHGWMILPDRTGFGPIYFCALERIL